MGGECSTHGRGEMNIKFWLGNWKGRDHVECLGVNRKTIPEWILVNEGGKMWTGCIWLRTGTSGRIL
jgi:hypothetical protein